MKPSQHILKALAVIITLVVPLLASPTPPRRSDNTLRGKRLRISASSRDAVNGIKVSPVIPPDTLFNPSRDSIQVSGYDKPLRTSRETMLVTNATSRTLDGMAITLSYTDMQGRRLHERTDTLHTSIPAGDTRMIHLPTWDTQHSYYYHRGKPPRTANVTPYDIRCKINFILYSISN